MQKLILKIIVTLGILTVIFAIFPAFLFFLMIFIPAPLLIIIIPTVFLYLTLGYCAWVWTKSLGNFTATTVTVLSLSALAIIPPYVANSDFEEDTRLSISGDKSYAAPVIKGGTVAWLRDQTNDERNKQIFVADCDILCQFLLLNGQVERVIVGFSPINSTDKLEDKALRAYSIVQQDVCTEKQPNPELGGPAFDSFMSTTNLINSRIAAGNCFTSSPAELKDAAHIVVFRKTDDLQARMERKNSPFETRNVSLYGRIESYVSDDKDLILTSRQTMGTTAKAITPFHFSLRGGRDLHFWWTIARTETRINNVYPGTGGVKTILSRYFGDGIAMPTIESQSEEKTLRKALDDPNGPKDDPRLRLANPVFERIGRSGRISAEQSEMVLKVISDRRLTGSDLWSFPIAVRWLPPDTAQIAASAILQRIATPQYEYGPAGGYNGGRLGRIVEFLPYGAFKGHLSEMLDVIQADQTYAPVFIMRLADEGKMSLPHLLRYLNTARPNPGEPNSAHVWDVYRKYTNAAARAILALGEDARDGADDLLANLKNSWETDIERQKRATRLDTSHFSDVEYNLIRVLLQLGYEKQVRDIYKGFQHFQTRIDNVKSEKKR